ncbi:uncharacterized protein LOC142988149 [Genypterus blacodes]|uniref:uncharacterized protein LOC142988149 n=1 Tax=Genypterus blacodes TaxID=154954 RepID=UPI003F7770B2
MMKRKNRVGLENLGLQLELTDGTGKTQLSACPQGSRSPVSAAVKAAACWVSYSCSRWKKRGRRKLKGLLLDMKYRGLAEDEDEEEVRDHTDGRRDNQQLNRKLLDHFRQLAASDQDTDQVDLQYLDQVISEGANPNTADRYGQTVLHEISRAWSVDVMRFFLDRDSDLLRPDHFGVTPLHVAAALDYQEMVRFLLDRNGVCVWGALSRSPRTPLHYAAKYEALDSIRLLLDAGAQISCTDYKQRTPLQLAANMDRCEAAGLLLELGAEAGVKDSDGQLCITALIGQMSPVARLALAQFHLTDRLARQQHYYLNLLEPGPGTGLDDRGPTSPLEVLVQQEKLDLIMHPVVLKLIQVKWELYGRLVFIYHRHAERNLFDWLVYVLLAVAFCVHMVDVFRPSAALHTASLRLFASTVIFLWLRLMKHVRAFRLMGPFIVMLGNIVGDVMRFLFLYAEIFIPYACAFWIIFGGVFPSMQSVPGLLYSLYRITLVDEYEYAAMVTVDDVMAPLLCGTFLAASSILCVNLLIALLTDTFQRVHDNSQAIAVMQQAAVILQVEESIPLLRRFYDNQHIFNLCAPLTDAYNDDITTNPSYHDEMSRINAQIKETLDEFLDLQRDTGTERGPGLQTNQDLQNQEPKTFQRLQTDQDLQNQELKAIRAEMKQLRTLVQELVQSRSSSVQKRGGSDEQKD